MVKGLLTSDSKLICLIQQLMQTALKAQDEMKKESTLRRKPITPESGENCSAADLEREMEEMRNRLLGK